MLSSGHHRHSIYKHTYTHKHIHAYLKNQSLKTQRKPRKETWRLYEVELTVWWLYWGVLRSAKQAHF